MASGGLLILLACGCTQPRDANVAVERQAWTSPVGGAGTQLLTAHYDLRITSRDQLLIEYLPAFMETCHREYRSLLPAAAQREERMVVYLFAGRPEWAAFTRRFDPLRADTYLHIHSGGYCDQATATAVMWDVGRDRTLALLAHEGLHQFAAATLHESLPSWLGEGLATQFEAFDLDGPVPRFTPRRNFLRTSSLREALLLEDGLIGLDELLTMDAGQAVRKANATTAGYYAQVWSLVLFLREDPRYAPGFRRLLADAGTPALRQSASGWRVATPADAHLADGPLIFRHYLSTELTDLTEQYTDFCRKLLR